MKSPMTGKPMPLVREKQFTWFRKESFLIYQHYYLCADSGGQFSTRELTLLNQRQVHNKYCEAHGLPYGDEIAAIRKSYGLSASKMAEVLGFGVNVYRNYENGEIPSISNARLIQLCKSPENLLSLLRLNGVLKERDLSKLKIKISGLQAMQPILASDQGGNLLASPGVGVANGFITPDAGLLLDLIKHFTAQGKVKLKWIPLLLFLVDFSYYRHHGMGVTGLRYHIDNQTINISNFLGLVNWAASMGYCDVSFNQDGQVFLSPGKQQALKAGFPSNSIALNLDGVATNILKLQLQQEFSQITADILDSYNKLSTEFADQGISYDVAFELNCLDQWELWN